MGLNDTPSSERIFISFFGRTNAGKSSVVNAVTNQETALVSPVSGTTTDPVYKAMELLPAGPVMLADTPGYDDDGELGGLRFSRMNGVLNKTDVAVLVADSEKGLSESDREMIYSFEKKEIPYIIAYNKCDIKRVETLNENEISISALYGTNINELKNLIALTAAREEKKKYLVKDLISKNDVIILVTPIDESAPKGRIILPQQQTIRDILDSDAVCFVCKDTEYENLLKRLNFEPSLVITDSQVFGKISDLTPEDIPLTSFSILMARYKGFLDYALKGVTALDELKDGACVLIAEGCTHHRQCNDIGSVKLPKMIEKFTGKKINFEFSSGSGFPENIKKYDLIIHCGGCMLNDREIRQRMKFAHSNGIPVTNYGTVIAYIAGILKRATEIFNF